VQNEIARRERYLDLKAVLTASLSRSIGNGEAGGTDQQPSSEIYATSMAAGYSAKARGVNNEALLPG
jgi:hypothetical protein